MKVISIICVLVASLMALGMLAENHSLGSQALSNVGWSTPSNDESMSFGDLVNDFKQSMSFGDLVAAIIIIPIALIILGVFILLLSILIIGILHTATNPKADPAMRIAAGYTLYKIASKL